MADFSNTLPFDTLTNAPFDVAPVTLDPGDYSFIPCPRNSLIIAKTQTGSPVITIHAPAGKTVQGIPLSDKVLHLPTGADLLPNGDFADGADGWTVTIPSVTFDDGHALMIADIAQEAASFGRDVVFIEEGSYRLSFNVLTQAIDPTVIITMANAIRHNGPVVDGINYVDFTFNGAPGNYPFLFECNGLGTAMVVTDFYLLAPNTTANPSAVILDPTWCDDEGGLSISVDGGAAALQFVRVTEPR